LSLNLPISARVRRDFQLDCIGGLLYGLFNGTTVGYLYVVARTIGVSQLGLSLLVSMGAVGAVLSLPASILVRSAGRPFMFGCYSLGRAGLVLLLLHSGPSFYLLLAATFLITGNVAIPFYAEVMAHIYPQEFRGRLMSLVRIGSCTATAVGSLLSAWLLGAGRLTFQDMFAVGGVLALGSLVSFAKITPVKPQVRPRASVRDTFAILRRNRPFATYQLWVMFMGAGHVMSGTLYPLVIVDKLHAGYGPFGVLTVITSLGYMSSFLLWGRIMDRSGPVITILLVGICVVMLPAGMLIAPGVYWLAPVMFITGVANAGFEIGPVAAVINYALATPGDVPLYMALHTYLSGLRGLICPFVATLILAGHHYGPALGTALALSAVGTLMLWQLAKEQPQAS
jgi:MFS family permease